MGSSIIQFGATDHEVITMSLALGHDVFDNDRMLLRLPSLEAQLAAWIDGVDQGLVSRCLHLRRNGFQLYVRKSRRDIEGMDMTTLDIASLGIPKKLQGRGWFQSFRSIAQALNPWDVTYYEMVHNQHLAQHLEASGLSRDSELCFYALTHRKTFSA
jgi:hypothetical protein